MLQIEAKSGPAVPDIVGCGSIWYLNLYGIRYRTSNTGRLAGETVFPL